MAYWNYRIVKREYLPEETGGEQEAPTYSIHEAHYAEEDRDNPKAVPVAITEGASVLTSESVEGLKKSIQKISKAFTLPILNYEDF